MKAAGSARTRGLLQGRRNSNTLWIGPAVHTVGTASKSKKLDHKDIRKKFRIEHL